MASPRERPARDVVRSFGATGAPPRVATRRPPLLSCPAHPSRRLRLRPRPPRSLDDGDARREGVRGRTRASVRRSGLPYCPPKETTSSTLAPDGAGGARRRPRSLRRVRRPRAPFFDRHPNPTRRRPASVANELSFRAPSLESARQLRQSPARSRARGRERGQTTVRHWLAVRRMRRLAPSL